MTDKNTSNSNLEQKLWATADKLRNNMDAAEYKHIVLGIIFLKYISDAFTERNQFLNFEIKEGANPEDPDEYRRVNIFWVPVRQDGSTCRIMLKDLKLEILLITQWTQLKRTIPT